uniref:uncharacterized protein LOC109960947 n=1 Tax=Monopterus albus TaxID=43700 RepID=UPI0009B45A47|nr:uncharacterized protein LOC109960947 [Monopterus albus]
MDSRQQRSSFPSPTVQYQHVAKRHQSFSTLSASSGPAALLRGAALKNQPLQQKTGVYSHRSPAATERTNGTCSAYSSPQILKREVSRSKDTLDRHTGALTQKALWDLQLRQNTNKNWTFGKYRLRSVDNADEVQQGQGRGRLLYIKSANGNEIAGVSSGGMRSFQKEMRNISNQELGVSEIEVSRDKSKTSYQTFNMPRRGREPGKGNMAAVAPFRFRFQVHNNTDASLDDLSDCSSDSMEVCCDEITMFVRSSEVWCR